MGTIDTLLRVRADSSQAVRGLAPLQASLNDTAADAKATEAALDTLSGQHVVSVNDQAVENARREVERLRDVIRERLRLNPEADTKDAQKRIRELQSSIKTLAATDAVVDVAVTADTTGLLALETAISAVQSGLGRGTGAGPGLVPGLSSLTSGLRGVSTTGLATAGVIGVIGVTAGVAAKQAWDLGEAAANVQTNVAQLNALTGGFGQETFEDLNKWATTTPFALEDATAATKRLVAAGVDLQQIPQYLNDIGNVAAATGVPLQQIATVFSQMESKGKLTFEETQQLAEAGIPVWATLAEKLGLTVAEVQKLATEGKLGADAVDLLRVSLAEQFPNAMAEQAGTFNGQMSTLKDTIATTRAELGTLFLPMMQDTVSLLQMGADAASKLAEGLTWVDDKLKDTEDSSDGLTALLVKAIPGGVGAVELLGAAHKDAADAAAEQEKRSDALAESLEIQARASVEAEQSIQEQADSLKRLEDNVKGAADAYHELVDNFTAFNSATIDARSNVFDYQAAVDDLAESLVKSGSFSPDAEEGRTNWDNLVGFAEAASERVEDTWRDKGKGAAVALQASFRQSLHRMLVDAGINSDAAWKLVDQVLKQPHKINVELGAINDAKLRERLAELRRDRATVTAEIVMPGEGATAKEVQRALDERAAALRPIQARIQAVVDDLKPERDKLAEAANPDDKARKAHIQAEVDPASITATNRALDGIIRLRRTAHIEVVYDLPPPLTIPGLTVGPTAAGPTAGPTSLRPAGAALMASPATTSTTGAWGPTLGTAASQSGPTAPQVVRLAPKQTPVAVYLDGVEIAHRIEARRALAASTSVRRSA